MRTFIRYDMLDIGKTENEIEHNLEQIIKYIYEYFPLDHDKMIKLYEDVKVPVSFDDEDDDDNDYRYDLTFVSYPKPDDKYIYKFNDQLNFYGDVDDELYITEIHKYLAKYSPKRLRIKGIKSLYLSNHRGVNSDARGVKMLDWKLHYWEEYGVGNDNDITFDQLIIALYKIRSHKFERWYETFCRINSTSLDGTSLTLDLKFIHGS